MDGTLQPQHQELIDGSAISADVATDRGYRSATTKADLERLGFSPRQRNVPALLIPIRDVTGNIATYQLRPDSPRISEKGKPVKYETPKGSKMVLDVPKRARPDLGDPAVPLFITEGARKADAGVTAGLCTVALLGVWNFRGTNAQGGKTALPDWESVALNNRTVYIVFDSDVMTKDGVRAALVRLKPFLEQRGAEVRLIYLSAGEGGTKVGLDDFFAAGHTVQNLLDLATAELRGPVDDASDERPFPYEQTEGGLVWHKPCQDGTVPMTLTNFTAEITGDIAEDDGLDIERSLEIEAKLRGQTTRFRIPATAFASMNWAISELGPGAIVNPGFGQRDHARAAIQYLSTEMERRTVYRHLGWRKIEGHGYCYLHAGGAIGPKGPVQEIVVDAPVALAGYVLPDPGKVTGEFLAMLDLGPDQIVFPVMAAVWRAAMSSADFCLHLAGPTGTFKTELAALAQQHWGEGLDARHIPGSWSSTGNSLEVLAFSAKDALLVVDDFNPCGSSYDIQRAHKDADRILRAQGNRAGRGRLRSDATLKQTRFPRGIILSTGEDVPAGHSLRARMFVIEVAPGDLDKGVLTKCQAEAAGGTFARTMAAFLQWVAGNFEQLLERMNKRAVELRDSAIGTGHARTPSIVGQLQAGFEVFLAFGVRTGIIDKGGAEDLRKRCWTALLECSEAQAGHLQAAEPTQLFPRLLQAALAAGEAHIADPDGEVPPEEFAAALGWGVVQVGSGDFVRDEWRPRGSLVGWIDGDHLYLQPDAAYRAAQRMGSETERLTMGMRTLAKRMSQKGLLVTEETARGKHLIRKTLQRARQSVLHVRPTLVGLGALRAQRAQSTAPDAENAGGGPIPWARNDHAGGGSGPASGPDHTHVEPGEQGAAPDGPIGPETEEHHAEDSSPSGDAISLEAATLGEDEEVLEL